MIAQTWVQTFNKNKNTNSEGTELVLQLLCVTVVNRFPYAEKRGMWQYADCKYLAGISV